MMLRQPYRQRAQAAHPEVGLLRARADAQQILGVGDVLGGARIASDGAEDRVSMADDVLGRRLDRYVDAVLERFEVERARPGVVHQQPQVLVSGNARNRGDVLHLEGL
jgi:hypothetical protein